MFRQERPALVVYLGVGECPVGILHYILARVGVAVHVSQDDARTCLEICPVGSPGQMPLSADTWNRSASSGCAEKTAPALSRSRSDERSLRMTGILVRVLL